MIARRIDPDDLANRFDYHPPGDRLTVAAHEGVRATCRTLAEHLVTVLPPGREASLAVTKLEEVMFWANAAIARHQPSAAPPP